MNNPSKWQSFIKEISNLIFFWFFSILFFTIYRSVFILLYYKELGADITFVDFFKAYSKGFRFDCTAATYFIVIPFVVTLIFSRFNYFKFIRTVRIVFQYLFIILSTLVCVITLNYYKEYNDQFNMFLFLGMYDDQEAIFHTIVEYYHPILNIMVMLAIITASIFIFKYYSHRNRLENNLLKVKSKWAKTILVIITITLFVFSIRGSVEKRPVGRKWAIATSNRFLNKTIINPYRTLLYAYDDFKSLSQTNGENPYGADLSQYGKTSVHEIIEKKAKGTEHEKPKQIFMVIMESYDSWPLLDKYAGLGIADNLKKIANGGTTFMNFLPSYDATVYAYTALTTGIPHTGLNISKLVTTRDAYITATFQQFKKLGYKTNAFYAGDYAWENFGVLSSHLGCDKVHDIMGQYDGPDVGIWGVDDEHLFDYILEHVDPEEYTFNIILTLSNHPPFSTNVYAKGFMYKSDDDIPESMRQYYTGAMSLNEMGHIWYGDWAIGRFMDVAKGKYPDALFAFTGDHFGRKFINHNPNLYERSSVPFILYGKDVPVQKLNTPGSHIDIVPTLIEMTAPKDFTYYSFGKSMFDENKSCGINLGRVVDADSLYQETHNELLSISLNSFEEGKPTSLKHRDEYDKLMQLAWHYIVRGDSIPPHKEK